MKYLAFDCHLDFASPVRFTVNPLFMMRSVIGASLRHTCCLDLDGKCCDCTASGSCVYAQFFEGHSLNDSSGMRMQAYSLHQLDAVPLRQSLNEFEFRIIIYGDAAVSFYPYIYLAMVNAGKRGVTKDRIPFEFKVVSTGLTNRSEALSPADSVEEWAEDESAYSPFSGKMRLELVTPLRFQYGGHYGLDFSDMDLFRCLGRRMRAMLTAFGSGEKEWSVGFESVEVSGKRIRWADYSHYSARQKESMKLGGLLGEIELEGDFSAHDMMILDFAQKFSAGKNVVFGLGNIEIWKRG